MLRLCPARAFIALACLCTKRLSVARSRDVGLCMSRFPVAVATVGATEGFGVSLTAEGGVAFCFSTLDVPSRDSSIFDLLSKNLWGRTRRTRSDDFRAERGDTEQIVREIGVLLAGHVCFAEAAPGKMHNHKCYISSDWIWSSPRLHRRL